MIEILVVEGKVDPSPGIKKKTCNYCKKKGPIKNECYKLQNKLNRQKFDYKGK